MLLIPDSGGKLPMPNILTRLWPLNLWAIGKAQRSLSPNRPLTLLHCLLIISHRKITVMNMSLCSSPFQAPGGSVKKRRCQSKIYRQSRSPIWDQTLNTKLELVSLLEKKIKYMIFLHHFSQQSTHLFIYSLHSDLRRLRDPKLGKINGSNWSHHLGRLHTSKSVLRHRTLRSRLRRNLSMFRKWNGELWYEM